MKKIILASSAALIVTLSFASVSEAGYRWNDHHHYNGGIDFVFGVAPTYVDDSYIEDESECYYKKIRKINSHGDIVIKRVQVCD